MWGNPSVGGATLGGLEKSAIHLPLDFQLV
jgi:hypothetical protein